MLNLCWQQTTLQSFSMFRKQCTQLVLSGLLSMCSARGVAWDLINLVEDMD